MAYQHDVPAFVKGLERVEALMLAKDEHAAAELARTLVLVDNGSADGRAEYLKELAGRGLTPDPCLLTPGLSRGRYVN